MLLLFTKPFVKIPLKRSNKKANGKQFILKTLQVHNSFVFIGYHCLAKYSQKVCELAQEKVLGYFLWGPGPTSLKCLDMQALEIGEVFI